MEELQPSTNRPVVVKDESQPLTSHFVVEDDPQTVTIHFEIEPDPLTCHYVAEDKPRPSTSQSDEEDEPPVKRSHQVRGMWNLVNIYRKLGTREQAVAFAEEKGMIPRQKMCNYHKKPMNIQYSTNKTVGSFACNRGRCRARSKVSRGMGTLFENVKMEMPQLFYIMYAYSQNFSYDRTIKEDFNEGEHCLSRATINSWFNYLREVVVAFQKNKESVSGKMGGPDKVVKIDERQFGKKKYNKVRQVDGHWILGMTQDGSQDLRLEVCSDDIYSAEVLVNLIKKHVMDGSTIHTDCWRAYDCLKDHGFTHHKVNRSDPDNPFVSIDSKHNIRTESQWRDIKQFFYKGNHNNQVTIDDLVYEYLWRRDIKICKKDAFEELIKLL